MTSEVDICNRALSEIGARATIASLTDTSSAAVNCAIHFATLRKQLIRSAPWGFVRKTAPGSLLGSLADSTSPYPWAFKYAYPADCLKVRYILPPPFVPTDPLIAPDVSSLSVPWCAPSRSWRFLVADDDSSGHNQRVILSNVENSLLVYNKDVTSPDLWDDLFQNAMVAALAHKIILALTGNAALKDELIKLAMQAITEARTADGNEAIATTDHVPDWMQTRGIGVSYTPAFVLGYWQGAWDSPSWAA